jgi:hypothetical protein
MLSPRKRDPWWGYMGAGDPPPPFREPLLSESQRPLLFPISRIDGYTAETGSITVRLTDTKGAFTNVSFVIPTGQLDRFLAILLTAASNGSTVYAKADPVGKTLSAVYYNID